MFLRLDAARVFCDGFLGAIPAKQPEKFHIQTIETIKLIGTIQIDRQLKKIGKKKQNSVPETIPPGRNFVAMATFSG